jgi:hypothetical protein
LVAGVGDLALAAQGDALGRGGAAQDGVLVAGSKGLVQARLVDRAAGAHLLGGLLGAVSPGSG